MYQERCVMANKRITIRLVGSEKDGGDVRLSEFLEQLEAFSEALRQTERVLSGLNTNFVYYKVVDLTHSSPATITLEAVARASAPVSPRLVATNFISGVKSIRNQRKAPAASGLAMLESYRALAIAPRRNIQRVEIVETPKKIIPIDSAFSKRVDDIIGPDVYSFGDISGRLESINLHNVLKCVIFPTVGPVKVACEFKTDLKGKVKAALDNYVTISGRLRYKQIDKFPYAIDAKHIDIHESHDDLPKLHDLRGIAANSTEGMSAEAFVRSLRDANW
jgi:hypothetical protein